MFVLTKDLNRVKDLLKKGYVIEAMSYIGPVGSCPLTFHMKKLH